MHSPPKKWIVRVKFLAIAYTSLCALLFCQQRLLFWPSRLEHTPSLYHLPYQDVWLPVSAKDGVEHIHGWWIPADAQAPVLLYLHHNAINIGANVGKLIIFSSWDTQF